MGIDRARAGAQNPESFYPDKAMQVRPNAIALTPYTSYSNIHTAITQTMVQV